MRNNLSENDIVFQDEKLIVYDLTKYQNIKSRNKREFYYILLKNEFNTASWLKFDRTKSKIVDFEFWSQHFDTYDELVSKYPVLDTFFGNINSLLSLRKMIKDAVDGNIYSSYDYDIYGPDNTLKISSANGFNTEFTLKLSREEFHEILGLSEEYSEDTYFFQISNSYDFDYFYDRHINNNSEEIGYRLVDIYYHLNDSNKTQLSEICNMLYPQEEFNESQDYFSNFIDFIYDTPYKKFIEIFTDLIHEYLLYLDNDFKKLLNQEIDDFFNRPCLQEISFDREGTATIELKELIYWMKYFNYRGDIKTLIIKIIKHCVNNDTLELEPIQYSVSLTDENIKMLNSTFDFEISKIVDELENDVETENLMALHNDINKILPINKEVPLPRNKDVMVKYLGVDSSTDKINLYVRRNDKITHYKLTKDGVYSLLYNLSLFDDY